MTLMRATRVSPYRISMSTDQFRPEGRIRSSLLIALPWLAVAVRV